MGEIRYPYHCFRELGGKKFYEGRYWNTGSKGIAIIAVVTTYIDWSAYIGSDNGQYEAACCQWTADYGNKLKEEDARYFFPEIALPYRG